MDMSKYKGLFISEAREHIQGMSDCTLVLEGTPDAADSINELFRHAHSVKGMSASMGYGRIAELAHRLEDLMDTVRKGVNPVAPALIDIVLQGLDFLEGMVGAVERDESLDAFDTSEYLAQVTQAIAGRMSAASPAPPPAPPSPAPPASASAPSGRDEFDLDLPEIPTEPVSQLGPAGPGEMSVRFRISEDSLVPCARAYLAVKKLETVGEVRRASPTLADIKAGRCTGEVSLVLAGAEEGRIRRTLDQISEMGEFYVLPAQGSPAPPPPAPAPPAPQRAAPASAAAPLRTPAAAPRPAAVPPPAAHPASEAAAASAHPAAPAPKTVRISTALLDTFINLVGELIVTKSRLNELLQGSGSRAVDQVLTRLDHLVGGLHGEIMKVRMTPLDTVTQRLPRVVRDLSRKRGKKVNLEIVGAEIELDRAILEELGDPLIHLLRNSVDHGIEDEAARREANKPENGRILLRSFRERDMVYVEISDDGRGMDLDRIKVKAIEKGIITADQARVMSEEETVMLVCRPGFSTATEVTDVSGRGVGMDVVQSVVESLGGTLSIQSSTGVGTTFTLKLPLTVAIVKMLLVRLAEHVFAIPITRVVRTVRVPRDQVRESRGRYYLPVQQDLVTLFELRELLALPGSFPASGLLTVVLVEVTNRMVGIVVDRVAGQVDIVVKPLCYPLQHLPRYSGMTVLGDGRIVPILDLGHLF